MNPSLLAILVVVLAGGATALQAPTNALLARPLNSPVNAALMSFAGGTLVLLIAVAGVGSGFFHPAGAAYVAQYSPPDKRGLWASLFSAGGTAGSSRSQAPRRSTPAPPPPIRAGTPAPAGAVPPVWAADPGD